jgi:hypothetical protein
MVAGVVYIVKKTIKKGERLVLPPHVVAFLF